MVSMNQILLFKNDFTGENTVTLSGRRFLHLQNIVKPVLGEFLKVGVADGLRGNGKVSVLDNDSITLAVDLCEEPPRPSGVTLVAAVPRPKVLRRLVQSAVSMGVKRICFIRSWRVDKSYFESPVLSDESLFEDAVLGLEQCRDTVLPRISVHHLFKPFVEDILPELSAGTMKLLAHPYTDRKLPYNITVPVTLVIGPEGGFVEYEIALLEKAGFLPYSIGERILRVETAVPAILGRLGLH
jgi:16S rRNA (uracil1498-N3)-methyltransferase